jgi:hypothetical protein
VKLILNTRRLRSSGRYANGLEESDGSSGWQNFEKIPLREVLNADGVFFNQ